MRLYLVFAVFLTLACNARAQSDNNDMLPYQKAYSFLRHVPDSIRKKDGEFNFLYSEKDSLVVVVSNEIIGMELAPFNKKQLTQLPYFKKIPNLNNYIVEHDIKIRSNSVPVFMDSLRSLSASRRGRDKYVVFFSRCQDNMLYAELCLAKGGKSYSGTISFSNINCFLFVFDENKNITHVLHSLVSMD